MRIRRYGLLAIAVTGSLILGACGSDDSTSDAVTTNSDAVDAGSSVETTPTTANSGPVELSLVAFSVPKAANAAIETAFAATPQGEGTTWIESYGASGDQSRAVVAGLEADYVHFSLEGDVTRLVKEGLVAIVPSFPRPKSDWKTYTHALDRDTMLTPPPLGHLDEQLIAMMSAARAELAQRAVVSWSCIPIEARNRAWSV